MSTYYIGSTVYLCELLLSDYLERRFDNLVRNTLAHRLNYFTTALALEAAFQRKVCFDEEG